MAMVGTSYLFQNECWEKMQLAELTHLKFAFNPKLQLVDHIHIIFQHDVVV